MTKKIIFLIILGIFSTYPLWADDGGKMPAGPKKEALEGTRGLVIPGEIVVAKEKFILSEVDKKNALQSFDGEVKQVKYNEDGTFQFM